MENATIKNTKKFLIRSFQEHPHYSFNDWRIMYRHSVLIHYYALKILEELNLKECDKVVLSIGALLHDIGKTYKVSEEVLRKEHRKLGYKMSKDFIKTLGLTDEQETKLKEILSDNGKSIEKQIIEDADIVAFFADKTLQAAFKKWVNARGFEGELKRKVDKFHHLVFDESKKFAKPFYLKLKSQWE